MNLPRLVTIILIVGLTGSVGTAQDKPQPPPRTGMVPGDSSASTPPATVSSISLPEFEIAGTEVIHLDQGSKVTADDAWSLRKSTLAATPGDRGSPITQLGFAETAGLPDGVGGLTGRLFAGFGSFQTPSLDLWLGASSPSSGVTLRTGYASSRGHVENADYQDGNASLSGDTDLGRGTLLPGAVSLGGTLGFQGRSYQPYGSVTPDMDRSVNRFNGTVRVSSNGEDEEMAYNLGFSVGHASLVDTLTSRETEIGLLAAVKIPADDVDLRVSAEGWRDYYSAPSGSQDPYLFGGDVTARYPLAADLHITGGLGFYTFRGSRDGASFRVLPSAGVTWQSSNWLSLSARFAPFIDRISLSREIERNRYVVNGIDLVYPEYHTNLEIGAEVEPSSVLSGSLVFRYQRVRNVPISVEQVGIGAVPQGLWGVEYSGTTRIFGLDAEVSATLTSGSMVLFSFAWRDVDNAEAGGDVPYAPKVQAGALYRHELPYGFAVQTDLMLLGDQYAEFNKAVSLKGYAVWNAQLEYKALPPLVLGLGVMNILDQSYQQWRGYVEQPRTAMLYGRFIW